ncbi:hypothetical protein OG21DRAFT_536463 [Imleria badia]|nr:hypothetical protein OG21DRAFT_536463 [Imleria badia]
MRRLHLFCRAATRTVRRTAVLPLWSSGCLCSSKYRQVRLHTRDSDAFPNTGRKHEWTIKQPGCEPFAKSPDRGKKTRHHPYREPGARERRCRRRTLVARRHRADGPGWQGLFDTPARSSSIEGPPQQDSLGRLALLASPPPMLEFAFPLSPGPYPPNQDLLTNIHRVGTACAVMDDKTCARGIEHQHRTRAATTTHAKRISER